jgi:LAO/AO transport system kinase
MERHTVDPGVFIRSLSSRGHLGGLSRCSGQVVDLMDCAGFDLVLVETVGVGQSELAVCEVADTVLVVLTPESGDTVQAMKAGLLEIADLFVVNKADREGAEQLVRDIQSGLELRARNGEPPEVVLTRAVKGEGVAELVTAVERHRARLEATGAFRERRRRAHRYRLLAETRAALMDRLLDQEGAELEGLLDRIEKRELTPRDAAEAMIRRLGA